MNRKVYCSDLGPLATYKSFDQKLSMFSSRFKNPKLTILDLDNRLKDFFDALQGFVGDKGKSGELRLIIPNDSQIYRVIAEKRLAPKVNRAALSTIVIRRYDHHGSTARAPRDARKRATLKGASIDSCQLF